MLFVNRGYLNTDFLLYKICVSLEHKEFEKGLFIRFASLRSFTFICENKVCQNKYITGISLNTFYKLQFWPFIAECVGDIVPKCCMYICKSSVEVVLCTSQTLKRERKFDCSIGRFQSIYDRPLYSDNPLSVSGINEYPDTRCIRGVNVPYGNQWGEGSECPPYVSPGSPTTYISLKHSIDSLESNPLG